MSEFLLRAWVALVAALAAAAVAGCGGASPTGPTETTATSTGSPSTAPRPTKLRIRTATARLPEGLSGEAVVADHRGVLSVGGLDPGLVSTQGVLQVTPGGVSSAGQLAAPLHDAAAAMLSGHVFVFGGGAASTIADVEELDGTGSARVVGALPATRSDLSALTVGGRAYVLAGFDGTSTVPGVLATANGTSFRDVATMPVAVRYAAVAAAGGVIYAFGGELVDGGDTDVIQAFDPRTGRARVIGRLPRPFSHASALSLGGRILILGGRIEGSASDQVLAFDPSTQRVSRAGRLPRAVTNAAAAASGGIGYLVGGLGADGGALRTVEVLELVPA